MACTFIFYASQIHSRPIQYPSTFGHFYFNSRNKQTCRVINPTKTEIGKVSKVILDRINTKIRQTTNMNQWKNTNEAIEWYKQIEDKPTQTFISFDVCDFYPSITRELLQKVIHFANTFDTITEHDKHIILHTKQTLLYNNNCPWRKRSNQLRRDDRQLRRSRDMWTSRTLHASPTCAARSQCWTVQRRRPGCLQ